MEHPAADFQSATQKARPRCEAGLVSTT